MLCFREFLTGVEEVENNACRTLSPGALYMNET